uniref:Uncharacterized protein n=1 Tax=Nelumbo nucifera TaxID=4432 RepID=A0A822YRN1_NELNU|nr:TPA_asm: hypothetical protein HUJ06_012556 [Nelumbo nucifera]
MNRNCEQGFRRRPPLFPLFFGAQITTTTTTSGSGNDLLPPPPSPLRFPSPPPLFA